MHTAYAIASLIVMVCPIDGQTGLVAQGKAFCFDVGNIVGGLITDDPVKCIPTAGALTGTISPIIIFEKPFLAVPAAKKAHLLATLLAVGKTIRDSGAQVDVVLVSDVENMKTRRAYSFDGKMAASLQAQVESGRITVNVAYQKLLGNLKTVTVPKTR
jgi:hypothetical protein